MTWRGACFTIWGWLLVRCTVPMPVAAGATVCPQADGGLLAGYALDVGLGGCMPDFTSLTVNGAAVLTGKLATNSAVVDLPPGVDDATVVAQTAAPGYSVSIDKVATDTVMRHRSGPVTTVLVELVGGDAGVAARTHALSLRWAPYYAQRPLPSELAAELGAAVALSADGRVLVSSRATVTAGAQCTSGTARVIEPADGGFSSTALPASGCAGWSVTADGSGRLVAVGNVAAHEPVQVFVRTAAGWSPMPVALRAGSSRQVALTADGAALWATLEESLADGGSAGRATLRRLTPADGGWAVAATLPEVRLQFAVSADEGTVAIGTGARVELYAADAGTWSLAGSLTPPQPHAPNDFGSSLALSADGTVLVASARESGVAYAYERTVSGDYALRATLAPLTPYRPNGVAEIPVAIDGAGARIVVGFPLGGADPLVATRDAGTWSVSEALPPPLADQYAVWSLCGNGVALSSSGDTALVGCMFGSPALVLWRH